MEKIRCILCGVDDYKVILKSKDYRFHLSNNLYHLVECNRCGLTYLNPMPTEEEVSKFYPENYYTSKNLSDKITRSYSMLMEKMKAAEINKYKNGGRILDLGCGTGDFLSVFDYKKWERFGIDISERAYKIAENKIDNVFCGRLVDCKFPNKYFDVVTLNHVLEHIIDPREELNEIFRILNDDGILFIRVPNIDTMQFKITREFWLHLDVPRHIYFYSKKTVKLLLEKSGFKVIKISCPLFEYPLDFFHSLSRKYTCGKYSKLKNILLYFFAPFTFFSKLFPQMRGTIQLIAQKV